MTQTICILIISFMISSLFIYTNQSKFKISDNDKEIFIIIIIIGFLISFMEIIYNIIGPTVIVLLGYTVMVCTVLVLAGFLLAWMFISCFNRGVRRKKNPKRIIGHNE